MLHKSDILFSREIRTLEGSKFAHILKIYEKKVRLHIYAVQIHTWLHTYLNYKYVLQMFTVPSEVLDLRSILISNTQLVLYWRPPSKPSGKIIKYNIILKVMRLYVYKKNDYQLKSNHYLIISNYLIIQNLKYIYHTHIKMSSNPKYEIA